MIARTLVPEPARGDIWIADLSPTRGHEQSGHRPVLVVSNDIYNQGPARLVVVLPLTSRRRGIPLHLDVEPPEGGLTVPSAILCDAIRSIAQQRLLLRLGHVEDRTIGEVEERLRGLLVL